MLRQWLNLFLLSSKKLKVVMVFNFVSLVKHKIIDYKEK